ncbi:hypothetical protein I7I53_03401 [Histoplasma capsulatum var. duboisii H88]|uniref:Uncharacterized protein n=1 Tax=Ajellomyces capsulatus (strain H88) TaxID=544711 RepID=A0A8A1LNG3_AJEC8|nr:hypothetical protein I7I53_03401 [Histoplasma capsulatum var. duboisii H88]
MSHPLVSFKLRLSLSRIFSRTPPHRTTEPIFQRKNKMGLSDIVAKNRRGSTLKREQVDHLKFYVAVWLLPIPLLFDPLVIRSIHRNVTESQVRILLEFSIFTCYWFVSFASPGRTK